LYGCRISGHPERGAVTSTLNNCVISGNTGGGAAFSTLNNCTVTGNSTGGVIGCIVNNCVIYYNTAAGVESNYDNSKFSFSCTTPLPSDGVGNISDEPQLASSSHLSAASPCRAAGSAAFASGTDIDGEAWGAPPSMGADEFSVGATTGSLTVGAIVDYTNVVVGLTAAFQAGIEGRANASRWDFGDGTVVSNRPLASHAWSATGTYQVILRAYNESFPQGLSATVTVQVVQSPVYHVALESHNPQAPYNSWATAARDIQSALDVAIPGSVVLVSNGVYATGGRAVFGTMTNRIAVTKALTVRSVNGPETTVIRGQGPTGNEAIRCAYLGNGAVLEGFSLSDGATQEDDDPEGGSGGGVLCESTNAVVHGCILSGNSAETAGGGAYSGTLITCWIFSNSTGSYGGGVASGTLFNCVLTGNEARWNGGGAAWSVLNNCTLAQNDADRGEGEGADSCILNNCILYLDYADTSELRYCLTTHPQDGTSNIVDDPLFVNAAGGDFRLQPASRCIDAGNNLYVAGSTDLDGLPRIVGGTVDIGAYEFQGVPARLNAESVIPR
jgi:hypothetical protein